MTVLGFRVNVGTLWRSRWFSRLAGHRRNRSQQLCSDILYRRFKCLFDFQLLHILYGTAAAAAD